MPRVTFLSRGPDDPKHQASGTVWLKHQHDRVCGDTMLQLQVDADPLASEGHCHCIFSFPGFPWLPLIFFPNTLTPQSKISTSGKAPSRASLLPAVFLHLLSSSIRHGRRWPRQVPSSRLVPEALNPGCPPFSTPVALPPLAQFSTSLLRLPEPLSRICPRSGWGFGQGWGLGVVLVFTSIFSLPQENVKDKLRAIVVTLSYSLQTPRLRRQAPGQGLPPMAPILNAHQPSTQRTEVSMRSGLAQEKKLGGTGIVNPSPVTFIACKILSCYPSCSSYL